MADEGDRQESHFAGGMGLVYGGPEMFCTKLKRKGDIKLGTQILREYFDQRWIYSLCKERMST